MEVRPDGPVTVADDDDSGPAGDDDDISGDDDDDSSSLPDDDDAAPDDDDIATDDDDAALFPFDQPELVAGCEDVTSQSAWCFTRYPGEVRVLGVDDGDVCTLAPLPAWQEMYEYPRLLAYQDGWLLSTVGSILLMADLYDPTPVWLEWMSPDSDFWGVADRGPELYAYFQTGELRRYAGVTELMGSQVLEVVHLVSPMYSHAVGVGDEILVYGHVTGLTLTVAALDGTTVAELGLPEGFDISGVDVLPGDAEIAVLRADGALEIIDSGSGALSRSFAPGQHHGLSCHPGF